MNQFLDQFRQFIRLRLFKTWTKCIIIIRSLDALFSPFAAIINTRNSRHSEEKTVSQRKMVLIGQNAGDSCYIMIIDKGHQMLSAVNAPLFRTVLAIQRMSDLEHIHTVETGVDSFVALIIRTTVEHFIIYDQIIIAEQYLADQSKIRFQFLAEAAQAFHKIALQTVGNIEPQSVDIEFFHPALHAFQKVIDNSRIVEIQFDQFIVPFPAFIPEAVIIGGITVKIDAEPVFVGRIPFLLLHILKSPETAPYMVEYTVQNNLHIMCMQILADLCEILVCPKATVDFFEIAGIISMIVRFKYRVQ